MATRLGPKPVPWHLWVVGVISLIWNGFGATDYVMTRLRNEAWLSHAGDPKALLAWIDSFPLWAQILWPVGVWSSVLGSLLLLTRSRHAPSLFLLSLVGAVGSFAYQLASTAPPGLDTTANMIMPFVIVAAIVLQWWYARRRLADGTLR